MRVQSGTIVPHATSKQMALFNEWMDSTQTNERVELVPRMQLNGPDS